MVGEGPQGPKCHCPERGLARIGGNNVLLTKGFLEVAESDGPWSPSEMALLLRQVRVERLVGTAYCALTTISQAGNASV